MCRFPLDRKEALKHTKSARCGCSIVPPATPCPPIAPPRRALAAPPRPSAAAACASTSRGAGHAPPPGAAGAPGVTRCPAGSATLGSGQRPAHLAHCTSRGRGAAAAEGGGQARAERCGARLTDCTKELQTSSLPPTKIRTYSLRRVEMPLSSPDSTKFIPASKPFAGMDGCY